MFSCHARQTSSCAFLGSRQVPTEKLQVQVEQTDLLQQCRYSFTRSALALRWICQFPPRCHSAWCANSAPSKAASHVTTRQARSTSVLGRSVAQPLLGLASSAVTGNLLQPMQRTARWPWSTGPTAHQRKFRTLSRALPSKLCRPVVVGGATFEVTRERASNPSPA